MSADDDRALAAAERGLAEMLDVKLREAAAPPVFLAQVTGTTPGGSGGGQVVTLKRLGTTFTANGYVNSYTPSVNDWVLGVFLQAQPFVLGKVIGSP